MYPIRDLRRKAGCAVIETDVLVFHLGPYRTDKHRRRVVGFGIDVDQDLPPVELIDERFAALANTFHGIVAVGCIGPDSKPKFHPRTPLVLLPERRDKAVVQRGARIGSSTASPSATRPEPAGCPKLAPAGKVHPIGDRYFGLGIQLQRLLHVHLQEISDRAEVAAHQGTVNRLTSDVVPQRFRFGVLHHEQRIIESDDTEVVSLTVDGGDQTGPAIAHRSKRSHPVFVTSAPLSKVVICHLVY